MTSVLGDFVTTSSRFSRSANIERDHGDSAIAGYVPTGRALDVISRISSGLLDPAAGRTFSITGPHGGGKSSLAVFLDGLLAGTGTAEAKVAHQLLASIDPTIDERLRSGMRAVKSGRSGFVRAFATARTEPVAKTIARGLHAGAVRQLGIKQDLVPSSFGSGKSVPSAAEVRSCVLELTKGHPLLLVIDEFGKNLEHFAASGSDGDPFLLQELAELTQGAQARPLVIITMQHLSFEEYVQDSSTARRREWSKVQGRFQDIPYVETAAQSRRLIASALEQSPKIRAAAEKWFAEHRADLDAVELRDVADDAAAAIPLNPVALAVLPELCSRYGQNERTLFSFLTGAEPNALPRYLVQTPWKPGDPLPLAGVDILYDYFLESSGSMIGVADGASRWIEIETRIRDTAGLSPDQLKVLKTIGLLNLVSSGGRIRASRSLLGLAVDVGDGESSDIDGVLTSLVSTGLITYRAFSDEYRIWHGSDYNLRKVIEVARQECEHTELAALLSDALPLQPLVAGRHSQRTGVLRVFGRQFFGSAAQESTDFDPAWDGIVYFVTDPKIVCGSIQPPQDGRPAIYVVPQDVSKIREAAVEAAALNSALESAEQEGADWVARRELVERSAATRQRLHSLINETWNARSEWFVAGIGKQLDPQRGLSAVLSEVADFAYPNTPSIANEMIARRELTSQGAKARRFLIDALLEHHNLEAFAIGGYGPERAMYEALFRKTGIHRTTADGSWALLAPTEKSWKPVWALMNTAFDSALESRLSLAEVGAKLTSPPVGLKDGLVPLLLVAGLVARSNEIALYEHGSLVLSLDDAVAERLTKNLGHFAVKNTQTLSSRRSAVITSLVETLGIRGGSGTPTFLNVATALFRELRILPPYVQKTRLSLSEKALAVREAFHQAAEPDVLVFESLPVIFGLDPFGGRGRVDQASVDAFASGLADVIRELRGCYPVLLASIQQQLARATSAAGDLIELRKALVADATRLEGHVLEPRLKAFVGALLRPLDDEPWLENVAMVVSEGQAPRVWTDDIAARFPLRVSELGGALRRTSALLHERLADSVRLGYTTTRMTLTRPDGTESMELLTLTEPERAAIDPYFEHLLGKLMADGLSRGAACRMLMARLASEYEPTEFSTEARPDGGDKRHA